MKLGPASPNYLQARDAILLADRVNTGGANLNELWAAFKNRGMGWSATCPPGDWGFLDCGPECPPLNPPFSQAFDLPPQGNQRWVYPASGTVTGIYSSPAVAADGTIYVGADDGKLYALNPANGTKIWEFIEASSPPQSFSSAPIVGPNGMIYARRSNGYLSAINPNGTLNWKTQIYYDSWVSPALGMDGTIYVAG